MAHPCERTLLCYHYCLQPQHLNKQCFDLQETQNKNGLLRVVGHQLVTYNHATA